MIGPASLFFVAQLAIVPRRGIDWGRLVPGVSGHVDPRDATRRGEIDFVGAGSRDLLVSLPNYLVSARGDRLPVDFRRGEVLLVYDRTGATSAPDPSEPIIVRATPETGTATLWLGGTAKPLVSQRSGIYEAVVTVASRVSITPTAVYLSNRERATALAVYNGDDAPSEVELSFAFGYPVSDSLGVVAVPLADHASSDEPSALEWLRVYPRRMVLQPKQRQLVRIAAYPPNIPPGEYWARLLVRSRPTPNPVDVAGGAATPRKLMNIESVFVTAVNYRNGVVTTGVDVDRAAARRVDSLIEFTIDLRRTGNAAYLGHLDVELRARDGTLVRQAREDLAVYHTLRRVIMLALPARSRGDVAEVRYRLVTERDDVASEALLRGPPREGRVALER